MIKYYMKKEPCKQEVCTNSYKETKSKGNIEYNRYNGGNKRPEWRESEEEN